MGGLLVPGVYYYDYMGGLLVPEDPPSSQCFYYDYMGGLLVPEEFITMTTWVDY